MGKVILSLAILFLTSQTFAEPPKQTAAELQTAINDLHILGQDFWIYNNLPAALEQAKKTNNRRTSAQLH